MKRVLVAFILTACAVSFAQAQTIQMKLGHYAAETHPGTVASKMFAEGVEQRTQGKIKIAVYPDNELGTPDDVLSKCIRGDVDMALPYHGHLGKYAKKFNCVMLPFVFDSYAHADSGPGRPVHRLGRSRPGDHRSRLSLELGVGVPQCHQQQKAGQLSGRRTRPDGADPAGAAPAGDHGGPGRGGRNGEFQRPAQGAGRGRDRRAGKPRRGDLLRTGFTKRTSTWR